MQHHLIVYSLFVFLINLCLASSMWMNPGVSVCHNQKPLLSRIQTTSSAAVTNHGAHCVNASFSKIPTISFDLGNEWDDFDDENLVHASEMPLDVCLSGAQPEVHQCLGYMPGRGNTCSTSGMVAWYYLSIFVMIFFFITHLCFSCVGFAATSAPVLLDHSQVKPCVTAARTPLR